MLILTFLTLTSHSWFRIFSQQCPINSDNFVTSEYSYCKIIYFLVCVQLHLVSNDMCQASTLRFSKVLLLLFYDSVKSWGQPIICLISIHHSFFKPYPMHPYVFRKPIQEGYIYFSSTFYSVVGSCCIWVRWQQSFDFPYNL